MLDDGFAAGGLLRGPPDELLTAGNRWPRILPLVRGALSKERPVALSATHVPGRLRNEEAKGIGMVKILNLAVCPGTRSWRSPTTRATRTRRPL
jgi:hypothetical protein